MRGCDGRTGIGSEETRAREVARVVWEVLLMGSTVRALRGTVAIGWGGSWECQLRSELGTVPPLDLQVKLETASISLNIFLKQMSFVCLFRLLFCALQ